MDTTTNIQLRTFSGGMLVTSPGLSVLTSTLVPSQTLTNRTYLPLSNDTCSTSQAPSTVYKCFKGGEYRTSENLGLVSLQTLFNREHNRVAAQLASYNPKWSDEMVFQETRRIIVALLQHITFNEFVPLLTGNATLKPLSSGYFTGYDPNVNLLSLFSCICKNARFHFLIFN